MALRINQNISALNAHRWLTVNDTALAKSIEHLSSGYRVNVAADDPAGLVISEKLRAQVGGLGQALANTQHAINMIKTAEGALGEVHGLLRSMRDLAIHAANTGVNGASEVAADQAQVTSALETLDRIGQNTQFGSKVLLDGTATGLIFQIGSEAGQTVTISITAVSASALGVSGLDLTTATGAQAAITSLDAAINTVSTNRVNLGAFQKNTLESNLNSLAIAKENLAASESTIRDADMALEMVQFTRNQILLQSGAAMLLQANQVPQVILQLLR
jgi:flagellin